MFRRARLSVRPNVRPGGRGGGAAGPEPQGSPGLDAGSAVAAASAEPAAGAAAEPPPSGRRAERDEKADSSNDAGEASKPAEMPTQRRKRISTLPNLAKPRAGPSSAQRSSSKPQRRASQASDGSTSLQKVSSTSEKTNVESSPKSPMLPEKKTPVPQVPQFSPFKKSANKEQNVGVAAQKNDDTLQKNVPSPLKERPTQERLVAQEEKLPTKLIPVKEKRICSDRERILKARKLREMLKEELKKERMKQLKHRPPVTEGRSPPDRSKMTMRDLIYYLPENNPMKSSLAEEKKTEKNSALGQMKEQEDKSTPAHEEEDDDEEAENEEESQDGPLLVPRVKVAEDGSIILDEESLTVEVLRTKGPCVVEENDPIFERGSTTTYSSFRKSFYTKPWSNKETDMFFLAISMVGTDFSLIGQLFPHRARAEIKNKFKREEKANGWRIDKAFKEKRPFDFEFFAQLLEKVLADEEKRKQKTVKSQKPKEKRPLRTRKKPKAKAASAEAASDQDNSQKDRNSDVETEADAVTAEKENEDSSGISERMEEQVALEPALAKKKRKRRRKDDLEQEVENLPEETAAPSKITVEGKSSKNTGKSLVCDTNSDDHTTSGEELDSVTEGKQDQTPVLEEERSETCLPVDGITESDLNLHSFQNGSDSVLETESAKLRMLDTGDEVPQESQLSKIPVSKEIKNKERQSEETAEAKDKDRCDSCKPDEKESASDGDFQSEIMETEKPAYKGRFQRPKPNLTKSSGRREAATQEKLEAETSSPKLVNEAEKCTVEDSGSNRNEITEVKNIDLETTSEEAEKTVIAKTVVRGCRQRFKPNITRASGRKEPEKDAGKEKMSHSEPKGEIKKNTDQSNECDTTSAEFAGKHDKVLETMSQSNKTTGLQQDSKQTVLKPALLKRGRMPRPKPHIGRTTARYEVQTEKKDPEEEKTECEELEKGATYPRNEKNGSCLKDDMMDYEDTRACIEMLEDDVSADSEKMDSIHASQHSPKKFSEAEGCECEKESSDVLNDVSDFNIEKPGPQKQEEKTIVSSTRLSRSRFQRPKPNLGKATGRKDVLDVNKSVSQTDSNKEECLMECDIRLPDVDKTEKYEVLPSSEFSGKENSLGSQEASGRPNYQSPEVLSRSEDGELKSHPPVDNQKEMSATDARLDSKNTAQEESKPTSLQPVPLARGRFQQHKPNLRTVGRKELQTEKNERDKKPQAEHLGENEVILHQADVLTEGQAQQEEPQVPHMSENTLHKQSSEKSISPEGKLGNTAQLLRSRFQRARPNLGRAYSKKESPVAQKLAALVEEEGEKGECLSMVEKSEEPLSSKDDMEVLLSVGNSDKNDSPETNIRSMKSEILCSPEKSAVSQKTEQKECLSTEVAESIQDTTDRSSDNLSAGEKSKSSDTKPLHQVRDPLWKPKSNLMRVTRKKDHSEEGGGRNEDDAEIRNTEECLSEKTEASMQNSSKLVEAASFSEATREYHLTDSEEISCKRIRRESKFQSPEISSESESQEEDSQHSASQEKMSDDLTRRQSRRSSERIASKRVLELRTASSASECEPDHNEKGTQRQKIKLNITKGKSLKSAHRRRSGKEHRSSKTTLVTLRASQEEEEEEEEEAADDFEPDDAAQCFAPEEVNKAPVFVPVGLRSPKPVPVQIEETMEELEISVNVPDVQVVTDVESLSQVSVQPVTQREENVNTSPAEANIPENPEEDKGINDGSTEAAMTLLAMGDPTFQLKINTEERTQMLPAQDGLHMADNFVTHACSEQSVISCQYLLSSPTSNTELFPSEDGSNINLEPQSTGARTDGEEYFEKNATETSDSSVPMVNSTRLTRGRLLKSEPGFGVLRSNKNTMQKPVNTNVLVEEVEEVQSEATVLRSSAEMQKMELEQELEQVRPTSGDSLDFHDFATGSTELVKQIDKTERTEKEMRNTCGTSGELKALIASPNPEASELEQELYPNQNCVDRLPEQNSSSAEHNLHTINFTQNEARIQDFQQQCISSTEETSVVNDDHSRCPEEEQTFILTLVEIPADSREYDDASALLEQASEPLLPAPILISPINASGTSTTRVESIGSLTTAVEELAASLDSNMETQLQSASVEPIPDLVQTTQKRSAAEPEKNDFPPAKKTLSTLAEGNLESTYKDYATKSTEFPRRAAENPLEKVGASVNKKILTSAFATESASLVVERRQFETLQNSGTASLENSTSKLEEEMISRLTSERKAEISSQKKMVDVHESGQSEHTGNVSASSKTPLLRGGRKPLGFLSLICKKGSSESAEDTKGNRGKIQKPRIVTSKRSLKKPTLSNEDDRESCSLPSTSTSSSMECENIAADATVKVPSSKQSEKPSLCSKDQEKEQEPTRISEYFFSDIFMEVDDSE
ncbi:transcription factor TFIIIB component B'' homolog isoform X2 [Rhea pennata]|uniref:transcription factor TFIIIB component B'' homolog isoform X2 n=1 Tax=Rhea pennata TaxID=8795 RepID=UPI002E2757B2